MEKESLTSTINIISLEDELDNLKQSSLDFKSHHQRMPPPHYQFHSNNLQLKLDCVCNFCCCVGHFEKDCITRKKTVFCTYYKIFCPFLSHFAKKIQITQKNPEFFIRRVNLETTAIHFNPVHKIKKHILKTLLK